MARPKHISRQHDGRAAGQTYNILNAVRVRCWTPSRQVLAAVVGEAAGLLDGVEHPEGQAAKGLPEALVQLVLRGRPGRADGAASADGQPTAVPKSTPIP